MAAGQQDAPTGGSDRRAWLTRQYDNRARLPGHPAVFARWKADSVAARARLAGHEDLAYGPHPSERMDVFGGSAPRAGDARGRPVLVFIHGGWWRALDKADHSFLAPAFVNAGAIVVVPNYALCPAVTIGDIAMQMARCLAQVRQHARQWGGDPARIVVAGHSAGGHLASLLLTCLWPRVAADLPSDWLREAVAISGVYDLAPLRETPFLQADLRLDEADVVALSPVGLPRPPRARLACFVGARESEEFLRHNGLMRQAWGARTVPVAAQVDGHDHLSILDDVAAPTGRIHGEIRTRLFAAR